MRLLFQEKTQVQKERPISLLALPPSEERNPDAPKKVGKSHPFCEIVAT